MQNQSFKIYAKITVKDKTLKSKVNKNQNDKRKNFPPCEKKYALQNYLKIYLG